MNMLEQYKYLGTIRVQVNEKGQMKARYKP